MAAKVAPAGAAGKPRLLDTFEASMALGFQKTNSGNKQPGCNEAVDDRCTPANPVTPYNFTFGIEMVWKSSRAVSQDAIVKRATSALAKLQEKHSLLRMTLLRRGMGKLLLSPLPSPCPPVGLRFSNLTGNAGSHQYIEGVISDELNTNWHMGAGPMMRVTLVTGMPGTKVEETDNGIKSAQVLWVLFTMAHSVFDGRSAEIMAQDFVALFGDADMRGGTTKGRMMSCVLTDEQQQIIAETASAAASSANTANDQLVDNTLPLSGLAKTHKLKMDRSLLRDTAKLLGEGRKAARCLGRPTEQKSHATKMLFFTPEQSNVVVARAKAEKATVTCVLAAAWSLAVHRCKSISQGSHVRLTINMDCRRRLPKSCVLNSMSRIVTVTATVSLALTLILTLPPTLGTQGRWAFY
mmetsp:Transcript_75688/g.215450  ORF Transcript_75688/g.215450 Transcript_75688/m.215450 type:complete len:409 (+) Transcript_75688:255-1481(+)